MTCGIELEIKSKLIRANLTNMNLSYSEKNKPAILEIIKDETEKARKKYKIDKGNLYSFGANRLIPNKEAFEAIENSSQYIREREREQQRENLGVIPLRKEQITSIKEGVAELFEQTPELANLGTKEQYSIYLDTIFPDSKVKDIVYHGTDKKFDKFDKLLSERKNTSKNHEGWYFTKTGAKSFVEKELGRTNVIELPVLLDMQNPYAVDDLDDIGEKLNIDSRFITEADLQRLRNNNFDSVYTTHPQQKEVSDAAELVVFEPEQIHILGSKQDIEGFKEFVQNQEEITSKIKSSGLPDLNINC